MSRSRFVERKQFEHLLAGLMPENREALRLSLDYGLRIGDVLRMPAAALDSGRWNFKEEKTGKQRRIRLSASHIAACRAFAGKYYTFEHRTNARLHRTRQAVYKDLRRIAKAFRLRYVSPHSARKIYAVERFRTYGDIKRVQRLLNHSDEAVTVLYALADQLGKQKCIKNDTL